MFASGGLISEKHKLEMECISIYFKILSYNILT